MADEPIVHFGEAENEIGEEGDYFMNNKSIKCLKLHLPENFIAYFERQETTRDTQPLKCDYNLVQKVISNYIIAKLIISNLSWQEKILSKHVCTTWHSAVSALRKEQLDPEDFVMDLKTLAFIKDSKYKKSGNFYNEPLVVLTFSNTSGFSLTCKCACVSPPPCTPPCDQNHCMLDYVEQLASAPKHCMFTAKASYLCYMPLQHSKTSEETITRPRYRVTQPFIGGVYIPVIPDVQFHIINITSNNKIQEEFYNVVDKFLQNRILKGALVYVTEKFLLNSVEDIVFLNHFKDIQPDVPYALGGCIVEDAIFGRNDINNLIDSINEDSDYVSDNLVSIGLFTVPKNTDNIEEADKFNFEMYSTVIEASDWTKPKILASITEFSKKVPRFEYSVALKLSCVGRDRKHEIEQEYFRAAFPQTRLIGCYGNGELGINHPVHSSPPQLNPAKKQRYTAGPQFGIMYSYSTVFIYIGWGKITSS